MIIVNPQNAKFVAEISGVRELRLVGRAKLDFWNKRLTGESFQALQGDDGFAEITVAATELVWKGFQFNELTISLCIAAKEDSQKQIGYLLLHAFGSNRFFAFCERVLFSTPYRFGKISLREEAPCSMNAWSNNQNVLKAEMSAVARTGTEANESWEGLILLPTRQYEKYFIAKLSGKSKVYPFIGTDRMELRADVQNPVFTSLVNSEFAGKEWRVRSNAFHARSKTYRF